MWLTSFTGTQSHLLLLQKRKRAATFLLEMGDRTRHDRTRHQDEIGLPMSRQDIADYLAVTGETVSRTLTKLENTSAIALRTTRSIVLRDRAGLEQMVI